MNNWIKHDGKGMPIEPLVEVDVRYRDGEEQFGILAMSCGPFYDGDQCWWSWQGDEEANVVAYRISKSDDATNSPRPTE